MDTSSAPLLVTTPDEMSIGDILADHAAATPDLVLLEENRGGVWHKITAAELHQTATDIAKGLIAAGIGPGDRVGIMSRTRVEWTMADFGIWYAGAVSVPVYETSSADQSAWILGDSNAKVVIVESAKHAKVVQKARAELPDLQHVWQIDDGGIDAIKALGKDVSDDEARKRRDDLRLDDLATIIYTSGTTGRPKGAELTHSNFVELSRNTIAALGDSILGDHARTLLFMPLAHVFARFVEVLVVAAGRPMGFTADTATLMDDIATFKPTFILSVPRVFEKVYNSSEAKAAAGGKVKIFRWAAAQAVAYSRALDEPNGPGLGLKLKHKLAHALVLSKISDALGGAVEFAISGGAPLGERLGHFFRGVGVEVLEGYGLTETTAPVVVNVPAKVKIGTVGPPLPGIELKIDTDIDRDESVGTGGEILTKGIAVFRGYHNNPEATAEALDDGWFRTGDLGEIDSDGYLKITGRKKEIIVTAGGKNVAPSVMEDSLRAHALVSQCVVLGDQRPFVAALITLDEEMLPGWLAARELPEMTVAEAAKHPRVLRALQRAVDRTNKKVSRAESIRRFEVLDIDFTIENDYLTPSMKVKRGRVLEDYADLIDDLYERAAEERSAQGNNA